MLDTPVWLEQLALDTDATSVLVAQREIEVRCPFEPMRLRVGAHWKLIFEATSRDASARHAKKGSDPDQVTPDTQY